MQGQSINQALNNYCHHLTKRNGKLHTTLFSHGNEQGTFQPNIGLDASARQSVVDILNFLLADETVLLLKINHPDRQANGEGGTEPQAVFSAQTKQINAICNEIMERIQILGGACLKDSEALLNSSRLGGRINSVPGIVNILADHEAFIRFIREDAQKCSEIYEDQGTFALLVSIMCVHEKMAWMLRSSIEPEPPQDEK